MSEPWVSVVRAIVRAQREVQGVTDSNVLQKRMPRGAALLRFSVRGRALADALVKEGWTPPPTEAPR